jgi:hypothetical protein
MRKLIARGIRYLLLLYAGKNPDPPKRDVFDVTFDNPDLTLEQAYWLLNRKRIIAQWLSLLAVILLCGAGIYFLIR